MSATMPQETQDLSSFLAEQSGKDTLRFITCGSVDDGKSTLIGRLLYDSKLLLEDQVQTLERESALHGKAGESLDFSLLVDGLQAEREQGITIDVAYRFFETGRRKFIVADTPGHEQYTRNMATGASTAQVAVILIDARQGVLTQTRRHATIVSMMGIKHIALAINKMDLVGFDQHRFDEIVADFRELADRLDFADVTEIPVSALNGDNVFERSSAMPWYHGPALMAYLEQVDVGRDEDSSFRFPVQWVNRPDQSFRGYSGTICGGRISVGDEIEVLPSGKRSKVERIVTFDGDLPSADSGMAVTLSLVDEIDISRGDMIIRTGDDQRVLPCADKLQARLVWMGEDELVPGRKYVALMGPISVNATVIRLKHRIDFNTGNQEAARTLSLNEAAEIELDFDRPIPFDRYLDNRVSGSFVLVDRFSNATVAAGMVDYPLRRAANIVWHDLSITSDTRAAQKNQQPLCFWFTGLSGAGKSTVANLVDRRLFAEGFHTYLLDGDNVRHGLNNDLGFTETDRVENIRRMGEVAKLMVDAGLVVLVCAISPFRNDRQMARSLFPEGQFIEVFLNTPLEVCEERDPKGLYRKAREGLIPNFTGISSPYEIPENPEIELVPQADPAASAEQVYFNAMRRLLRQQN